MFKPGDKVKCINSDEASELTEGKVYTIQITDGFLVQMEGLQYWRHLSRFESAKEDKPQTLSEQVKALEEHRENLLKEIDAVLKQMDDSLQAMQELSKELKDKLK